jgi:hypothetical protein
MPNRFIKYKEFSTARHTYNRNLLAVVLRSKKFLQIFEFILLLYILHQYRGWASCSENHASFAISLSAVVADTPLISSCDQFWIGANDFDQNGIFIWTDNKPFQYANWAPGS